MEEKSYHYLVLFTGLFLCLLHSGGVSSSCDNINQIDFAEITYEPEGLVPHPDGTVASIECGVFYQIVPTAFERTTCTDGSWTGPLPRCRHVPRYCHRNEDLVQIYGRDCQTQCRNRLNGACLGNKQCHCDGVCGWSCISIYEDNFCPEVADQAGRLVTYDPPERRFNGFADFSCGDGYIYHSGSSRLLCMSNRQWGGGNEFVCIPNDNQNPVITCPADFTSDTLTVSFLVYVTDNADPAPALTYDPLGPGSTFPLGPTTVTVTATDSSSNHDSCTFTVTVIDNQNPVITCPADFNSDTLTVSFLVDVTDNVDPAPALTYDPLGPGSTFPLGPTTVTVTATDSSSNHDSCTFTVTVTVPCGHLMRASRNTIEIL
ncbi:sushi, von Willebrand factor type A, EGF and pentraxin domain-containing protein 1 [Strongylocentrotus purpuratus]|uniref:Sushi, von Willebrand factor type A, EGF and pentraxin domain-containing protein 1-like n=1 Tax=Strongylocentrotus purpuratus TaxID=7668 RepID=A0A7M7T271_STRPU|nr:sushi, von Willebrand factor type A, EGF and pentraxin domain-containing protein 1 [Strongylocentrotus purpuratus]